LPDVSSQTIINAGAALPHQTRGTFKEVALASGLRYDPNGNVFAGMGADLATTKQWMAGVFVNALANQKYKLFRNEKGKFDDVTDSIGSRVDHISLRMGR